MKANTNLYWLEKDDPTIRPDYESDDDYDEDYDEDED